LLLSTVGGCVDKTTIEEMIDLGMNYTFGYEQANWVTKTASEMTHDFEKEGKCCPKDRFVATAVEAGLLDMLLKFLLAYGDYPNNMEFLVVMSFNIQALIGVAFSKHTSKAIRAVRPKVLAALQSPQIKRLNNNGACKMVVENLRSLVSMSSKSDSRSEHSGDSLCNHCSKNLSKDEERYCSKCKTAVYCSREW